MQCIEPEQVAPATCHCKVRLLGIVESAKDAIITVDVGQRNVLLNANAEQMFRCPAEDVPGQSLEYFIPVCFRAFHCLHIRSFGQTCLTSRCQAGQRGDAGLRGNGEVLPVAALIFRDRNRRETAVMAYRGKLFGWFHPPQDKGDGF